MKNTLLAIILMGWTSFSFAQIIQFADVNFKSALVNTKCVDIDNNNIGDKDADENNDGEIDMNESENISGLILTSNNISNVEGIEFFKNLVYLNLKSNKLVTINIFNLNFLSHLICSDNNLSIFTLSNLPSLINLNIDNNEIISINLSSLPLLSFLDCSENLLSTITISNLPSLSYFNCSENNLTSLNLKNLPALTNLNCWYNQLSSIDLSQTPNLIGLKCGSNKLNSLSLFDFPFLKIIECPNNELNSIYLVNLPNLNTLNCSNNLLNDVLMKIGRIQPLENANFSFDNNPNLSYICCDDNELPYLKEKIQIYGYTNCEVNSYCSFTPGGKFFTIVGRSITDINNNGCDINDIKYPKLIFLISSPTSVRQHISNTTGHYEINIQQGSYSLKPILEYPDYYKVSPDSITVTFPSTSDTIIQDFCIAPKSIYRQIDLSIIPIGAARPGFDAQYKVVMNNKGNQVENGTLYFAYDETRMDFVNTDVNPTTQGDGLLSWDFTNLLPFETRYYNVTLNVNSPSESPPVNAGDELLITCNILDNVFLLKQEVVGSYDPNDKTCLEGKIITPEQVGEYVHYLIRFENTGNYAAENVVVKDVIDASTFDLSTLQITDASHESWARINGNIVEFIFENIQLPFDDASNDGCICFKIKTKPTLVLGNELENEANIYFDYNLPILTNKTNTVVANLVGTDEAIGESGIEIFPNPVSDVLKFSGDDKILKVEIFDMSGRLVQVSNVVNGGVNVKGLLSEVYQLRVYTQLGVMTSKMVKI